MSSDGYSRAAAAEAAWYAAFGSADQADDIECIYQPGERMVSVAAVAESWRRNVTGQNHIRFQLSDINHYADNRLVMHVLYEKFFHRRQPATTGHRDKYLPFQWQRLAHDAAPCLTRNRYQPCDPDAGTQILH